MLVRTSITVLMAGLVSVGCSAPKVATSNGDGGGCGPAPLVHRSSSVCSEPRPASSTMCSTATGGSCGNCSQDSDCNEGMNGRCVPGRAGYFCSYDLCMQDTDCMGETCGCRLPGWQGANACVSGNCAVDSDCGACGFCSPSSNGCGAGYYCHTPEDECTNDSDCAPTGGLPPTCSMDLMLGHWKCLISTCSG